MTHFLLSWDRAISKIATGAYTHVKIKEIHFDLPKKGCECLFECEAKIEKTEIVYEFDSSAKRTLPCLKIYLEKQSILGDFNHKFTTQLEKAAKGILILQGTHVIIERNSWYEIKVKYKSGSYYSSYRFYA